ncbi:rolling circle replication-associated protein [Vibrio litoralis]|uniref:rolling circle replication-associated protein n=1 Tax=Vibrio litoralis TaxID=335972 RepID=UPI000417CCF7|nr:hypothetical protein [Vibrio litoralis]
MLDANDLHYIAGAVMPQDQIKKHNASFETGFFRSKINDAPKHSKQVQALIDSGLFKSIPVYDRVIGAEPIRLKKLKETTEVYRSINRATEHNREAAAGTAERHRLVKGRKSPTRNFRERRARQEAFLRVLNRSKRPRFIDYDHRANGDHYSLYEGAELTTPQVLNHNGRKAIGETDKSPISMQLMHREWNETFKFQAVRETPSSNAPDVNTGKRFTEKLTPRSVSRIFEAAAYTAQCHGGFTTFLTPTFSKEQRLAIFGGMTDGEKYVSAGAHHPIQYKRNMVTKRASKGEKKYMDPVCDIAGEYWTIPSKDNPIPKCMNRGGEIAGDYCDLRFKPPQEFTMEKTLETTIGKEVSRFLDGLKKMYQRGWIADHTIQNDSETGQPYCDLTYEKIPGHSNPSEFGPTNVPGDFHYIWVAECPANEYGEPNPHVHILIRWSVPHHQFSPWAKRIESLWGHGTVKVEKLRKPKAAGSYIIKAVGYAAKGENGGQGLIRGNRYSIAKCSRAPAWECLTSFEADNMIAVIKEMGYKLDQWKKPLKRQVNKLHFAKNQTIKAKAIAQKQGKPEEQLKKMQARIIRLEKQAEKLNQNIKERGVHVSADNRFCITFEGKDAAEKVDQFMFWAAGARGWGMKCRDMDMADIKQAADQQYQQERNRHIDKQCYWKAVINDSVPIAIDEDEYERQRSYHHFLREKHEKGEYVYAGKQTAALSRMESDQ